MVHERLRFKHQHIALHRIQHHLRRIADQRAGNPRACHRADNGHRRLQAMGNMGDQHIGRAFLDMQVPVVHVELGLEGLALLAIARLDGFLELKGRVCRRQHGRG